MTMAAKKREKSRMHKTFFSSLHCMRNISIRIGTGNHKRKERGLFNFHTQHNSSCIPQGAWETVKVVMGMFVCWPKMLAVGYD